jgi:hypothetical protein
MEYCCNVILAATGEIYEALVPDAAAVIHNDNAPFPRRGKLRGMHIRLKGKPYNDLIGNQA